MSPRTRLAALVACALASFTSLGCNGTMSTIDSTPWGAVDGQPVEVYTLTNTNGLVAKVSTFGATLIEMHVPDATGKTADVVLGFDSVEGYNGETNQYFGCTTGRVANRIAGGKFTLDGKEYTLATNNGPNHLHGGDRGFSHRVWSAKTAVTPEGSSVVFTYVSPDGEEGYPGTVTATATYTLTEDNELRIEMTATTDAPTPVNIVNHSYWNLAGHSSGDVRDHVLRLSSKYFTPTDKTLIPTGTFAGVADTPNDFRTPRKIGERIDTFKDGQWDETGGGYDLNLVVDGDAAELRHVATLTDPASGRVMILSANQPGVQLYTGNWIKDIAGKDGAVYQQHQGLCLETQLYPDAIHHKNFISPVLKPGETYKHVMIHKFGAK